MFDILMCWHSLPPFYCKPIPWIKIWTCPVERICVTSPGTKRNVGHDWNVWKCWCLFISSIIHIVSASWRTMVGRTWFIFCPCVDCCARWLSLLTGEPSECFTLTAVWSRCTAKHKKWHLLGAFYYFVLVSWKAVPALIRFVVLSQKSIIALD